uniref:Uncharacterized protein n=1 Tax=Physcomitrium patens TaxID=3218 RepID=A0A2K1IEV1_PHYPA|nr:hypothetical protein PHYPA_029956 [Physcomitrium patens]
MLNDSEMEHELSVGFMILRQITYPLSLVLLGIVDCEKLHSQSPIPVARLLPMKCSCRWPLRNWQIVTGFYGDIIPIETQRFADHTNVK